MGIRRDEVMVVNGRLTQAGVSINVGNKKHRVAVFVCECGQRTICIRKAVRNGHTKSCGCLQREITENRSHNHGHACRNNTTSTHNSWSGMIARCTNTNNPKWMRYGGRGITVCDRWQNSFAAFLEDMGERPPETTIDRKDNNGNYDKDNCRWATSTEQGRNKRNNRLITVNGKTLCMSGWADELGIKREVIKNRLLRGWSDEDAIRTPVGDRR